MTRLAVVVAAALCLVLASLARVDGVAVSGDLVNVNVQRRFDLTSCIVRLDTDFTVENKGSSAVSEYIACIPASSLPHLASLAFESDGKELTHKAIKLDGHAYVVL